MRTSAWNLQPPPGFHGLREDRPLRVYWRHLPHWRQDAATYFVSFRLKDSLPQSKLRELDAIKQQWANQHGIAAADCQAVPPRRISREHCEALTRALMIKVEGWLDEGMGKCWLARPEIGSLIARAPHYLDGDQYELDCHVVMPNHVLCQATHKKSVGGFSHGRGNERPMRFMASLHGLPNQQAIGAKGRILAAGAV